MVKNVLISVVVVVCMILIVLAVRQLKENYYKKTITEEISKKANGEYRFSGNKTRCSSEGDSSNLPEATPGTYKLVYEMNFDCSICYVDLKEIYIFYTVLAKVRKVDFFLISPKKSLGYIDFQINQTLKSYDIWVIQQEFRKDGTKLCLVDSLNNIVVAGDITRYPFLRNEYRKHIK